MLKNKNSLASLQSKLEASATGKKGSKFEEDTRFWTPTKEVINGVTASRAVIRLLPISAIDYEKVEAGEFTENSLSPYQTLYKHFFKGVGGFYIENSLYTLGMPCPIYDATKPLWDIANTKKDDALKADLRKFGLKKELICNILVVKDLGNPANDGKVMLFKMPDKLLDIVKEKISPQFDPDSALDPFNMFEGANIVYNLTYTKKSFGKEPVDVADYGKVTWSAQSPVSSDDARVEQIWKQSYSLLDFIAPKNFKSYTELQARYNKVVGNDKDGNKTLSAYGSAAVNTVLPRATEPSFPSAPLKSSVHDEISDDDFSATFND